MKRTKSFLSKIRIFKELIAFLWERKLWWMIPMVIILVLWGLLMILAPSSAVAPFIYTLF